MFLNMFSIYCHFHPTSYTYTKPIAGTFFNHKTSISNFAPLSPKLFLFHNSLTLCMLDLPSLVTLVSLIMLLCKTFFQKVLNTVNRTHQLERKLKKFGQIQLRNMQGNGLGRKLEVNSRALYNLITFIKFLIRILRLISPRSSNANSILNEPQMKRTVDLHDKFVVAPAGKAPKNTVFCVQKTLYCLSD